MKQDCQMLKIVKAWVRDTLGFVKLFFSMGILEFFS